MFLEKSFCCFHHSLETTQICCVRVLFVYLFCCFFPYLCHCAIKTEILPNHSFSITWESVHHPPALSTDPLRFPIIMQLFPVETGRTMTPSPRWPPNFPLQGSSNRYLAKRNEVPLPFYSVMMPFFVACSARLSWFMIFCHLVYFSYCFVLF